MKRVLFLTIVGVVAASFGLLVTCSSPLDSSGPDVNPGGNTTIVDTLYLIDTVIIVDSSGQTDTLFVTDTVIQLDTLIVYDSTGQVDTIIIVDTTILNDTVIIIDTTILFDTLTVYDTTTIVDTVIIVEPDTMNTGYICGRLGAHRKDLVWMFQNDAGTILFEFKANSEYDHPTQVLTIDIDGQEYVWDLEEAIELAFDQELSENAMIRIVPDKPSAYGHEVDICLTISPAE